MGWRNRNIRPTWSSRDRRTVQGTVGEDLRRRRSVVAQYYQIETNSFL